MNQKEKQFEAVTDQRFGQRFMLMQDSKLNQTESATVEQSAAVTIKHSFTMC